MKRIVYPLLALLAASSHAAVLKVDLNSSDGRKDVLTPHWSNWAWHEGHSGSQKFGDVTVTFRAPTNDVLSPILYKGLIDYGATMAADGVVVKGTAKTGVEMVISGLTPGKHTVVTYHNELRGVESGSFDVSVDGVAQLKNVRPTNRATTPVASAAAGSLYVPRTLTRPLTSAIAVTGPTSHSPSSGPQHDLPSWPSDSPTRCSPAC